MPSISFHTGFVSAGIVILFILPFRRWFSIQNNQLVYQKKFRVSLQLCLKGKVFTGWEEEDEVAFEAGGGEGGVGRVDCQQGESTATWRPPLASIATDLVPGHLS